MQWHAYMWLTCYCACVPRMHWHAHTVRTSRSRFFPPTFIRVPVIKLSFSGLCSKAALPAEPDHWLQSNSF